MNFTDLDACVRSLRSHGPKEFVNTDRIVECAAVYAHVAATVLKPV